MCVCVLVCVCKRECDKGKEKEDVMIEHDMTYFLHDAEELFFTKVDENISRVVIVLPFIIKHGPDPAIKNCNRLK